MRSLFAVLAVGLLAAPAASQSAGGAFLWVETGQRFGKLQEAVAAINDGTGTIRIAPGTYYECAVQGLGRVTYAAQVPGKTIFDRTMCEGKAALVLRGQRGHAERRLAPMVDAGEPAVLRADHAVQRDAGVPGLGRAEIVAHEARHGRLRGFAAVALGITCDKEDFPWNTKIAVNAIYRANIQTMTDAETGNGILDIL